MEKFSDQIVVICSNTPFEANPLGAKPLAEAMSSKCTVLYVDPPLSHLTAIRQPSLRKNLFGKKLSKVHDGLYRLVPVVLPGKDRPFINRITSYLLKKKILKAAKKIDASKKVALIATAPHYRIFDRKFFNIYWLMDDYASQPELIGIKKAVLKAGQDFLSTRSDVVVAVSEPLLESLPKKSTKAVVITNGADSKSFRFPNNEKNDLTADIAKNLPESNFALYVGGISDRIDLSYLSELAKSQVPIVIAGKVDFRMDPTYFNELCDRENVTFIGEIPNKCIPGLMNQATVGLVPYADAPFNKASMPLKIPEYLLCGLITVSTNLPFTNAFSGDDVHVGTSHQKFSEIVQELLSNPAFPSQRAMRSARIAQEWSWEKKAEEFLDLLA